ncbi:fatty acid synthase-like protein [Leptotrombidium deliense]|uniref:Fatty acid synthase n=1 Tax=Leptotrombidium deliense TaxID=299467 RepID=A0A443SSB0_9ACAR|nr:fatty acid synthase-like protein [Leptotrombidium deliense]
MGDNETIIGSTVPQRLPSCFVALDRFLQSPFAVCSSIVRSDKKTEVTSKSSHSLLEMITKILGLKNQSNLIPTITLAELGLDSLMGIEVKQTLERDYEVILSMSEIRSLTVNHLKEISAGNRAAIKETGNTAMQIDILMPFISIPTEVVVYLNDIKQGKPIFLLPPIDGIFDLLTPIAKLLKRPVIGLNWTSDLKDCKTVETAAAYYLNICKNIDSEGNFDVIGYSFGSVIAFEMALQEKVSNLILLDGSPSQLFANIQQYGEKVQAVSENQQQVEALVLLLTQYVSIDYAKTKAELLEINDVDARNVRATEIYLDNKGPRCEPEAIAFAAQAFYQKLKMIHEYRSSKKLDGNVFLIRAEELLLKNVDDSPVTQDYGLSEVITGECTVRTFKGNHKTFLVNNLKPIASVLNEKLC